MIKWHDLTKHPDDLPKLDSCGFPKAVAMVIIDESDKECGYIAQYRKNDEEWYFYKTDVPLLPESGHYMAARWAYLDGNGEEVTEDTPKPLPKKGIAELHKRLSANAFSIESRLDSTFERLKACEPSFPLGETTLAVKCAMAEMDSNIESAFADFERGEKRD